ncbi:hypothetical protein DFJ74DRAFT_682936 [Hyaloraphidium curvatum]|nr:hypothetical protein DFJ74DRAFT_682936 [Hyaloraphidium curvatum]
MHRGFVALFLCLSYALTSPGAVTAAPSGPTDPTARAEALFARAESLFAELEGIRAALGSLSKGEAKSRVEERQDCSIFGPNCENCTTAAAFQQYYESCFGARMTAAAAAAGFGRFAVYQALLTSRPNGLVPRTAALELMTASKQSFLNDVASTVNRLCNSGIPNVGGRNVCWS